MQYKLKGKRLAHSTMHNYTDKNKIGKLPEKRGPMDTFPLLFWDLLNCHVSMSQLERKTKRNFTIYRPWWGRHSRKPVMITSMSTTSTLDSVGNISSQCIPDKDGGNEGALLTLGNIPTREQVVWWHEELFDPLWIHRGYTYASSQLFRGTELPFPIEGEWF